MIETRAVLRPGLALLLLCLSWPVPADYWVRPQGDKYGTRDGKAYADAFSTFAALVRRNLEDKTVWICGEHRDTLVIRHSNTTVRLDCPNDPGTILGSERLSDDAWPEAGPHGPFRLELRVRPKVLVVDGSVYPERIPSELAPGYFAVEPLPGGGRFALHLAEDLRGREIEVGHRAFGIQIAENEKSRVHGLTVIGGGVGWIKYVGAGPADYPQGKGIAVLYDGWPKDNFGGKWLIDGVNFYGIQTQAIHAHGTSVPDEVIVRNCRILEIGGEGIYIKSVPGPVLVEDNEIGARDEPHFGWAGNATAFAGDGIDLGGSDQDTVRNMTIRRNRITNVRGTGIIANGERVVVEDNTVVDAYLPGATEDKGCLRIDPVYDHSVVVVRRNRCSNRLGHGIVVRGKLHGASDIRISSNVVVLDSQTGGYAAALHASMNVRGATYRNNTFIGGEYGLAVKNPSADLGSFEFVNNIVVGPAQAISLAPARLAGSVRIRNNVLHGADAERQTLMHAGVHTKQGPSMKFPNLDFVDNSFTDPGLDKALKPSKKVLPAYAAANDWPESDVDGRHFNASRTIGAVQR